MENNNVDIEIFETKENAPLGYYRASLLHRLIGRVLDYLVPYLVALIVGSWLLKPEKYIDYIGKLDAQFPNGWKVSDATEMFPNWFDVWGKATLQSSVIVAVVVLLFILIFTTLRRGKTLGKVITKTVVMDRKTGQPASVSKVLLREFLSFAWIYFMQIIFAVVIIVAAEEGAIGVAQSVLVWVTVSIPMLALISIFTKKERGHKLGRTYYDKILDLEVVFDR